MFVHGWGLNSAIWKEQVKNLKNDFTVITVDLPGHGLSKPLSKKLTIELCAEMLSAFIRENGFKALRLVGWSLGSQVILRSALELGSEHIHSLVFASGTPCYLSPTGKEEWATHPAKGKYFERQLQNDFKTALGIFLMTFFEAEPELTPKRRNEIKSLFFDKNFPPDKKSALELLTSLYDDDLREEAKELKVHCLICHGEHDMIVPSKVTEIWGSLLKSPKTVLMKNCGHAPFLTQPENFRNILKRFFAE